MRWRAGGKEEGTTSKEGPRVDDSSPTAMVAVMLSFSLSLLLNGRAGSENAVAMI